MGLTALKECSPMELDEHYAILPAQWLGRSFLGNPEQNLILAVLESACTDLSGKPGLLRDIAWAWIQMKDDCGPLSFENVCASLELEPEWARQQLGKIYRKFSATPIKVKRKDPGGRRKEPLGKHYK